MSDELERRLRQFPSEFPRPDEHVTNRVAGELRGALGRPKRRRSISRPAALLAALAAGAAIGSVATSASNSTVTIGVRPSVVRYGVKPEIFGAVTNAKAGEVVTVQFKQCGLYPVQYRDFMTTETIEGGAWSLNPLYVRIDIQASGTFRAAWGDEVSREASIKVRAWVTLQRLRHGRFSVRVAGTQSFWRRRVRLERFDTGQRIWILARTLLLTESVGSRDYAQPVLIATTEPFRPAVPKGLRCGQSCRWRPLVPATSAATARSSALNAGTRGELEGPVGRGNTQLQPPSALTIGQDLDKPEAGD